MIPFDIFGEIIKEPVITPRSVKFTLVFKQENEKIGMSIPVTMFKNRFKVEWKEGAKYLVRGGFESFPLKNGGWGLAYNSHHISMISE